MFRDEFYAKTYVYCPFFEKTRSLRSAKIFFSPFRIRDRRKPISHLPRRFYVLPSMVEKRRPMHEVCAFGF